MPVIGTVLPVSLVLHRRYILHAFRTVRPTRIPCYRRSKQCEAPQVIQTGKNDSDRKTWSSNVKNGQEKFAPRVRLYQESRAAAAAFVYGDFDDALDHVRAGGVGVVARAYLPAHYPCGETRTCCLFQVRMEPCRRRVALHRHTVS